MEVGNYEAIIGIDESYANTGIALNVRGKAVVTKSLLSESKNGMRLEVQSTIRELNWMAKEMYAIPQGKIAIVFERVRLFSNSFISTQYMVSMSYLNGAIIMEGARLNIPCFSVDTKCWKSHVVGSSKGKVNKYGVEEKKFLTLDWCMRNGYKDFVVEYEENEKKQKKCYKTKDGRFARFNDNVADAIAISMFYFKVSEKDKENLLKLES